MIIMITILLLLLLLLFCKYARVLSFILQAFFTKAESFLHCRIIRVTDVNFPFLLTLKRDISLIILIKLRLALICYSCYK